MEGQEFEMCIVTSLSSLSQIDMFILGYALEVKIKVFRLFKFNSRDFEVCYPEEPLRRWSEISLLTENDRHYHICLLSLVWTGHLPMTVVTPASKVLLENWS